MFTLLVVSGNRVFISFVRFDRSSVTYAPGYMVLDTGGNILLGETFVPGIQGLRPYTQQFPAGPILMTWINPLDRQINFVTIQSDGSYGITSGPTKLDTPEGLSAYHISLSQDDLGRAVLTWVDLENQNNLYYALIRHTGAILTPPIEFYDAGGGDLKISPLGKSCAPYIGKLGVYLPLMSR